ncbi:MAG TPA: biotin--[acetyl-CoA-carboxylase] ligase [Bacteroidota bacterium]|nr:biotin--[acetyl-CoA-carboxylase] ligase [Bacteroidota bacterium]
MQTRSLGKKIYSFETIDSTNTFARTLDEAAGPHGTLVVAEEQTAGKGRQGRRWQSQKGKNLLFSVILKIPFAEERIRVLPFAAALAAADGIEHLTLASIECKWPNDLLIGRKKVAGMLIEAASQNENETSLILGIGVNVNQTEFPEEIRNTATSLRQEGAREVDRTLLLCAILEELEHRIEQLRQFSPQILLDEWKQRTSMFGARIVLTEHDVVTTAIAVDVAPTGALVIEDPKGRRREVLAGDVTLGS